MTPGQLLGQPSATLGDALAARPGIASTTFAPGASRPVIRGLSGFRVRIQENGLSTGDVSALSDDHAIPIDPLAAGQVEVVRGPATLRYGSQAIGGVVNAVNNRIPTAIPVNGILVETRGGFSTVDDGRNGAAIVEAGSGNFVIHADTFARSANDYRIPQSPGRQANTSLDSEGYSLGGSYRLQGRLRRRRLLLVRQHLFHSRHRGRRAQEPHRARPDANGRAGASGASTTSASRPSASGSAPPTTSTTRWIRCRSPSSARPFSRSSTRRAWRCSTFPSRPALGVLRGAVGMQWSDRNLSAAGADGILLAPTSTQSLAGFIFEELQLTKKLRFQAAARIESDDVKGTASIFPPGFLPPPDDPDQMAAKRKFVPKSASAGILYDLPHGVVMRLTGQHVERAPDATELFYKGPHDSTATFEIGTPNLTIEAANTFEIGFKRAKGDFRFDVSAYRTEFKNFIFKRFTGAKCDDDFASCGTGTELDQIVYSQQDATFYGVELLTEYDIARIWRGVWGIDGQYDFVHATFKDGTFVPKMPPHRLGGGIYYRDVNWLARVNLLHAFRAERVRHLRHADARLQPAQRRAELHHQARSAGQPGAGDHRRHQGREPAQRRHPQQRLLQEGRGAAARCQCSAVRRHQAQLSGRCRQRAAVLPEGPNRALIPATIPGPFSLQARAPVVGYFGTAQ